MEYGEIYDISKSYGVENGTSRRGELCSGVEITTSHLYYVSLRLSFQDVIRVLRDFP